jgi:hypothetical protein
VGRKLRNLVFAGLVVLLIALGAFYYASKRSSEIVEDAKKQFEEDVRRSLPLRSERAQIEKFLADRAMPFTVYNDLGKNRGSNQVAPLTIEATGPKVIKTPLYDCSLLFTFSLDADSRMTGFTDRTLCSAPF